MIPFDFEYYRPNTAREAVQLFHTLRSQDKKPMYYGGGTEIISASRLFQLYPDAVIDIKGIPECSVFGFEDDKLVVGAAIPLTQVQEADLFPMLSWCGGRVADHTMRNKITLGGNICASVIPYRESILALLVADGELIVEGKTGRKTVPLKQVYDKLLRLQTGDLLLQVEVDRKYVDAPFVSSKKTSDGNVDYPQDRIGYPVVSAVFMQDGKKVRAAFSGLCAFPFRSAEMERALSDRELSPEERSKNAFTRLPTPVQNDIDGSAQYREFAFNAMASDALRKLEGDGSAC